MNIFYSMLAMMFNLIVAGIYYHDEKYIPALVLAFAAGGMFMLAFVQAVDPKERDR